MRSPPPKASVHPWMTLPHDGALEPKDPVETQRWCLTNHVSLGQVRLQGGNTEK